MKGIRLSMKLFNETLQKANLSTFQNGLYDVLLIGRVLVRCFGFKRRHW